MEGRAGPAPAPVEVPSPLRWLAGAAVAAVAAWTLLSTGVTPWEFVRHAAWWTFGLLVPGIVVHRALRGVPDRLLADLALGTATGITLEVLVGVALTLVDLDPHTRWWPLLVYAALFMPAVRERAARPTRRVPESLTYAWTTAAVTIIALIGVWQHFRGEFLPVRDTVANIDQWWHLGLVQEMLRPGPPMDPHVAGESLVYHWFSHFHMAVAGSATGIEPATIMLRLWIVPVVVAAVALVVTVGRQVGRSPWAGPLAAWVTFVAVSGGMLWTRSIPGSQPVTHSPSQMVSILVVLGAAAGMIDATRRRLGWPELAWLLLLTLACVGMKPTALPVMLCAALLAAAATSFMRRGLDWQLLAIAGALLAETVLLMPLVSGTSGDVTLLAALERIDPYQSLVADDSPFGTNVGLLVDTLQGSRAWIVAGVTLAWLFVGQLIRMLGFAALVHPGSRRDGTSWWLAGAVVAGWSAFFLADHPSGSQFYFLSTASVLGSLLTVRLVAAVLDDDPSASLTDTVPTPGSVAAPRRRRATIIAVVSVGAVLGWLARWSPAWLLGSGPDELDRLVLPAVVAAAGIVALSIVVRLVQRGRLVSWGTLGLIVLMVLGLAIPGSTGWAAARVRGVVDPDPIELDVDHIDYLTATEQEAALWLADHAEPLDLVATNLVCRPGQRTAPTCDARGFWLSGLSGRRVLLEGYAYRPETIATHGTNGRPYPNQPSPWPERFRLSQEVFTDPSPEVVDELRDRGVTWLVGVERAGNVAADELSVLADLEFSNEQVSIWSIAS